MADRLLPLQTHGVYIERWEPPNGRFWKGEAKDEWWMRRIGLGNVHRELAPLYDVRDLLDGELLGYTKHNPCEHDRPYLQIPYMQSPSLDLGAFNCMPINEHECGYEILEVKVQPWRHPAAGDWLAWATDSETALKLLRSGWIKAIGEDNKVSWDRNLRDKVMRDQFAIRDMTRRIR